LGIQEKFLERVRNSSRTNNLSGAMPFPERAAGKTLQLTTNNQQLIQLKTSALPADR
jgi:hypothetical protein